MGKRDVLITGLSAVALVAVLQAFVISYGLTNVMLVVLTIVLFIATYAGRRYARNRLVYMHRKGRS